MDLRFITLTKGAANQLTGPSNRASRPTTSQRGPQPANGSEGGRPVWVELIPLPFYSVAPLGWICSNLFVFSLVLSLSLPTIFSDGKILGVQSSGAALGLQAVLDGCGAFDGGHLQLLFHGLTSACPRRLQHDRQWSSLSGYGLPPWASSSVESSSMIAASSVVAACLAVVASSAVASFLMVACSAVSYLLCLIVWLHSPWILSRPYD
jgi:hypothetical protein